MAGCSVCGRKVEENAPILVMGAYGIPRFLCSKCEKNLDTATTSRDYDEIAEAMNILGENLSSSEPDELTVETLNGILSEAGDRAKAIKYGSYDFSLDEQAPEEEGYDDIPEDMKETEEDKALDEEEQKKIKKVESIFNVISTVLFSAVGAYAVYKVLDMFLF